MAEDGNFCVHQTQPLPTQEHPKQVAEWLLKISKEEALQPLSNHASTPSPVQVKSFSLHLQRTSSVSFSAYCECDSPKHSGNVDEEHLYALGTLTERTFQISSACYPGFSWDC